MGWEGVEGSRPGESKASGLPFVGVGGVQVNDCVGEGGVGVRFRGIRCSGCPSTLSDVCEGREGG
eukprot:750128-Hanusia_phi.AAC.1